MKIFSLVVTIGLCLLLISCSSTSGTITSEISILSQKEVEELTPFIFPLPPPVNEDKAVAISSLHVPKEIILNAQIRAGLATYPNNNSVIGIWSVIFNDVNVTREQLINVGWQEALSSSNEPYHTIIILVDAANGNVIGKSASQGIQQSTLQPEHKVTENEAKIIAARYVPPEALIQSEIHVSLNMEREIAWLVYFRADINHDELGWKEDAYTHLDEIQEGLKYYELVIKIDANTGDLIRRAAFAPPEVIPSYVPVELPH